MYLSQMAEIPLLSRDEEISLAKKIEFTRKRFRRTLLSCDLALRNTVETLQKVHDPHDRGQGHRQDTGERHRRLPEVVDGDEDPPRARDERRKPEQEASPGRPAGVSVAPAEKQQSRAEDGERPGAPGSKGERQQQPR
jgi:hypothetical protein